MDSRQIHTHESLSHDEKVMATSTNVSIATSLSSRLSLQRRSSVKLVPSNSISSDLTMKLLGDISVALLVTFGFSPAIATIDRAIVEKAAGTHTILQSVKLSVKTMAKDPILYVRSPMFLFMWAVYAATYSTANCLKTIAEHREMKNRPKFAPSSPRSSMGVFTATTFVNSYAAILKDRYYARTFGSSVGNVPLITYGLWGFRDCLVVGSAFFLPNHVAKRLHEQLNFDKISAQTISQLLCPVAAQFFAGPVHLLSLDMYNRPMSDMSLQDAVVERSKFVYSNFSSIVIARIARIVPAYGFGGIGNTYLRDSWRSGLVTKEHA